MSPRPLTDQEFLDAFREIRQSALRLEMQRAYAEDGEQGILGEYLDVGHVDPTKAQGFPEWYALVRDLAAANRHVARVRIHDDPPTDYQRFVRYIGRWNAEAGEDIRYLTRDHAREIGLPADDLREWWLLDGERLIVLGFTPDGRRIVTDLSDDPNEVREAATLWDVARSHAASTDRAQVA